jgi:hypothetical protein
MRRRLQRQTAATPVVSRRVVAIVLPVALLLGLAVFTFQ